MTSQQPARAKDQPPLLIDEKEAAWLMGMSDRWLRGKRGVPGFPQPVQLGIRRGVRYKRAELEKWVEAMKPKR